MRIDQGFLAEEEYPLVDIPNSLFEQLVVLRKRTSLFSENTRGTLISLFLANAIEYTDGEEELLVVDQMSFSCVLEENGKKSSIMDQPTLQSDIYPTIQASMRTVCT